MTLSEVPIDSLTMASQPQLSSIPAVADWVTIIAFPLTLLGLYLTYRQSKKSKSAADAAKESANDTSAKIESIQFMSTLSRNIELLKGCPKLLLESQWVETARQLAEARDQLLVIINNEKRPDDIKRFNTIKDSLNIDIRNLYSRAYDDTYDLLIDTIFDRINEIHEIFVTKQEAIRKS